jgi:Tfp pilus assembly protein PilX
MKLMKNSESGQALVLALIVLALGALLVIPTLNLTATSARYHQLIGNKTVQSYSADSGMEYALCRLYNAPGEYTGTPLNETFNLNDTTVHIFSQYLTGGVYKLTSTATDTDGRRTTIEANVNLSAGVFTYALAGKDSLTMSNTLVDSAPTSGNGDICSNGNITITGASSLVHGDARAAGTISGKNRITGDKLEYQPAEVFPGDYTQLYKTMALEGGTYNGDLTLSGGTQYLGPKYINGSLTVKPGTLVVLQGTVYITGQLKVEGGRFQGEQNVAVYGDIRFSGGGIGSANIPIFTANPGKITLVGPVVDAVIYAPNNVVNLTNLHLYGACGGKTVSCSNTIITWSASLNGRGDLPGGELKTISYSYK